MFPLTQMLKWQKAIWVDCGILIAQRQQLRETPETSIWQKPKEVLLLFFNCLDIIVSQKIRKIFAWAI